MIPRVLSPDRATPVTHATLYTLTRKFTHTPPVYHLNYQSLLLTNRANFFFLATCAYATIRNSARYISPVIGDACCINPRMLTFFPPSLFIYVYICKIFMLFTAVRYTYNAHRCVRIRRARARVARNLPTLIMIYMPHARLVFSHRL